MCHKQRPRPAPRTRPHPQAAAQRWLPRRARRTSLTLQAPHRPQPEGSIYLPPRRPACGSRRGAERRPGPARPLLLPGGGAASAAKPARPPRETAPRQQGSCCREPRRSGSPGRKWRAARGPSGRETALGAAGSGSAGCAANVPPMSPEKITEKPPGFSLLQGVKLHLSMLRFSGSYLTSGECKILNGFLKIPGASTLTEG